MSKPEINLLLLSNTMKGYEPEIAALFGASPESPKTILFVPYALKDHDAKAKQVADVLASLGINVISAHASSDPVQLLDKVDGVYVGGGNTFRLLDQLQKSGLLEAIKKKVVQGMPYMGGSAGINVVGPTIMTTNDMPIVTPANYNAMGLVPFQINPHFVDGAFYYEEEGQIVPYQGEARTSRIMQYHEENDTPVVGLKEGAALRISGTQVRLLGNKPAKLFLKGQEPADITDLSFLMAAPPASVGKKGVPKNNPPR